MRADRPRTTDDGPLGGLSIVDLSTYVAGPSATMTLAQLGADVIRIDPVGGATDSTRLPHGPSGESLYWAGLNKGKRSVEVDTSSPEGRRIVYDLIASEELSGVVLTNAIGQHWLSYEELSARRRDVIVVHISGHTDGRPAVDYTVNCEVGLPFLTGPSDLDSPVNHVLPAWDLLTGLHAALAVVAAERMRSETGAGQLVRLSLADVAVATMGHLGFVADVAINHRDRRREGNYLYGNFGCDVQTSDGARLMLVALTRRHWQTLTEVTGVVETIGALERALAVDFADEETRYRYREVIAALVRPWFEQRTMDDVVATLEKSGVLWGPYRTVTELVRDTDSILHRGELMVAVDHPVSGPYLTPRSVTDFVGWRAHSALAAPVMGGDTSMVLQDVLGMDADAVQLLRRDGVVGGA